MHVRWWGPANTVSQRAVANVILPSAMAESDARTIQAILAGEGDRYAELVEKYQAQALRLAFSLLGNYEDAKDASQEAFVNAYRSLARFRGTARFSTWLYRIVVNECKDVFKKRARQPFVVATVGEPDPDHDAGGILILDVDDPRANPSDQLANRELSRQLSEAIEQLPMKQRTAFVLHHLHGLSLEEVAVVMSCRTGTVKSHMFRATQHLRTRLTPWVNEEARS